MKEIEANKKAWGLLSKDHYEHFKELLLFISVQKSQQSGFRDPLFRLNRAS